MGFCRSHLIRISISDMHKNWIWTDSLNTTKVLKCFTVWAELQDFLPSWRLWLVFPVLSFAHAGSVKKMDFMEKVIWHIKLPEALREVMGFTGTEDSTSAADSHFWKSKQQYNYKTSCKPNKKVLESKLNSYISVFINFLYSFIQFNTFNP